MAFHRIIAGLFLMTVFIGAVVCQQPDSETVRKEFEAYVSKLPTVDYERVESGTAEELERRKRIGRRYDDEGWVQRDPHHATGKIGRVDEVPPPPLLPVKESALVIAGKVVSANAYLSNDKRGIYTEFSICVSEVLKSDSRDQAVKNGGCITADRPGGVVRMPTGQRVIYTDWNRELPQVGKEYAMFLTRDNISPNYSMLRLYELSDKRVTPVDHNRLVDELKLAGKSEFLARIRKEVTLMSEPASKP